MAPLWHFCVGTCKVESGKLIKIKIGNENLKGELQEHLFRDINIYKYIGKLFHNHKLLTLNNKCAFACNFLFKDHPCYMQSAASIFKNTKSTMSFLEIAKKYKNVTFDVITCQSIGLRNLPKSDFLDVAKTARIMIKDKNNDRSGGKTIQYFLSFYHKDN